MWGGGGLRVGTRAVGVAGVGSGAACVWACGVVVCACVCVHVRAWVRARCVCVCVCRGGGCGGGIQANISVLCTASRLFPPVLPLHHSRAGKLSE